MIIKPGDLILLKGEEDARETLQLLSDKGIGAVVTDTTYKYIRITSVPDDPEGADNGNRS